MKIVVEPLTYNPKMTSTYKRNYSAPAVPLSGKIDISDFSTVWSKSQSFDTCNTDYKKAASIFVTQMCNVSVSVSLPFKDQPQIGEPDYEEQYSVRVELTDSDLEGLKKLQKGFVNMAYDNRTKFEDKSFKKMKKTDPNPEDDLADSWHDYLRPFLVYPKMVVTEDGEEVKKPDYSQRPCLYIVVAGVKLAPKTILKMAANKVIETHARMARSQFNKFSALVSSGETKTHDDGTMSVVSKVIKIGPKALLGKDCFGTVAIDFKRLYDSGKGYMGVKFGVYGLRVTKMTDREDTDVFADNEAYLDYMGENPDMCIDQSQFGENKVSSVPVSSVPDDVAAIPSNFIMGDDDEDFINNAPAA